jgi:hypothetical protein
MCERLPADVCRKLEKAVFLRCNQLIYRRKTPICGILFAARCLMPKPLSAPLSPHLLSGVFHFWIEEKLQVEAQFQSQLPLRKRCTGCNRDFLLSVYYPHPRGKYGRASECPECQRAKRRERWARAKRAVEPGKVARNMAPRELGAVARPGGL